MIEMIEVVVTGVREEATAEVREDEGRGHQDPVHLCLATNEKDCGPQGRTSYKEVATQRTREFSLEVSPCK